MALRDSNRRTLYRIEIRPQLMPHDGTTCCLFNLKHSYRGNPSPHPGTYSALGDMKPFGKGSLGDRVLGKVGFQVHGDAQHEYLGNSISYAYFCVNSKENGLI